MNPFPLTSSETSQMVMDRILSHSPDLNRWNSGGLSRSSGHAGGSLTGSPPFSPFGIADLDPNLCRSNCPLSTHLRAAVSGSGGGKTVGRWFKERKERRKQENRIQNAQLHAAISVAGVAAAVAAVASASADSAGGNDDDMPKAGMAMASAAELVATQCVEAAEAMGADHDHLASVISSAVSVKSAGDIMTLTAAAATCPLRGAATLKSRAKKEVWSCSHGSTASYNNNNNNIIINQNLTGAPLQVHQRHFLNLSCTGLLPYYVSHLLKRTRNGDLHWKIVSVYINRTNQVLLRMKSRHVAGTITKKKKHVVVGVVKDIPAWPGRHVAEGGEEPRYFGLKTRLRGVVEFECINQTEYEAWTQGVSNLLLMVA